MGTICAGDVVEFDRSVFESDECNKIKSSKFFYYSNYCIVLGFWLKDKNICSVMNCLGEITWIETKQLKIVSRIQ